MAKKTKLAPVPAFDLTELGLLTTQEVARMFGVTADTITGWAAARTFPAPVRIRKQMYLWPAKAVMRSLAEYRQVATGVKAVKLRTAAKAVV